MERACLHCQAFEVLFSLSSVSFVKACNNVSVNFHKTTLLVEFSNYSSSNMSVQHGYILSFGTEGKRPCF